MGRISCYHADDVKLLGENIDVIKKNTESSTDAVLQVNAEKTKCMLLFRHQIAGQNRDIKIANRSF
jgi:hypothetical protein